MFNYFCQLIAKVIPSYPGYGKTIILECDVNDLPASKKALVKNLDTIYFIYALASHSTTALVFCLSKLA